jgi:hypothetical protein
MKNQNFKEVEKSKEVELPIHEVEDNAIVVNVDGWRMRIYFDKDANKELFRVGQVVVANYFGDITKPHSIRFCKLE